VIVPSLALPEPRSDEQRALNALLERRGELAERLREAEVALTFAGNDLISAEAAVRQLEDRRARGDEISPAEEKKTMAALTAARARRDEPWALRRDGARGALVEVEHEIGRYVMENYDALMDERAEEAHAVAERVDRAAEELLAAVIAREGVAQTVTSLIAAVGRNEPGSVHWSNAEGLAAAARALLEGGGERAPLARLDPRVPPEPVVLPPADSPFAEGVFPG
jgi:hypothetical protein